MFTVKNLKFSYKVDGREVEILKGVDFTVERGDFIAIQGPSGSGKSTLFYILGFMLKPTSGSVLFDGIDISKLGTEELTILRNQRVGFIFQQFHLLSKTSVRENILLPTRYPCELPSEDSGQLKSRAEQLSQSLGIGKRLDHMPSQLSGGEQQRVAIARALMKDVDILLADEPTGNLDSVTANQILDILTELNAQGKTIVLITHDNEIAQRCKKIFRFRDGLFTEIIDNSKGKKPSITPPVRPPSKVEMDGAAALFRTFRAIMPLVRTNLLRNKAKSALTMLGVIIGIAAVLSMVTLGQFAKRKILESYEVLGVNKLVIRGYPNWRLKATEVPDVQFKAFDWERDFVNLPEIFPEISRMTPMLYNWQNRAVAGGVEAGENNVSIIGVGPDYLRINNRSLLVGRNITPFHVDAKSPVCLIGYDLAVQLFPQADPLQEILALTDGSRLNFPCHVIGVLAPSTANSNWSPPNLHVLIPYTYFQTVSDGRRIRDVAIQVKESGDVVSAGKKIKAYFDQKYGKSGNFNVDSDSTLIAEMRRFLTIFTLLLSAIATLALVVGGIGINNMMLVAVVDRIKEFGIRKALGATDRSIRVQVLAESMVLCVVAGVLGILLGFVAYQSLIFAAAKFIPNMQFVWIFDPVAAALSFFAILVVGVASGLVPALRAEKLQVIEALRTE